MGQTTTWILVANASQALVYESRGRGTALEVVREFEHPESRAKGSELISDRPGHAASGQGGRRTAFEQNTEVRRHEQDRFAHAIAAELGAAQTDGRYDKLVLTASPAFLGMVKSHLPKNVERALIHTIDRDYTASALPALASALDAVLPA